MAITVDLHKGNNSVRLWNSYGRMPDIDYMQVDKK